MDHRQQAVADAGGLIVRVEQVLDAPIVLKVRVPENRSVYDQYALEVLLHESGRRVECRGGRVATDASQGLRQRRQHLVVQGHRPGTGQPLGHRGVHRLQRIIPVAVAVGRQIRTVDHALADHLQSPLDVAPDRGFLGLVITFGVEKNGTTASRTEASSDAIRY